MSACAPRPTFLGLEPLIVERLQAFRLPGNARVLTVAEFAGAQEASLPAPSVRVAYAGHRIASDSSTPLPPGWALIEQTWLVVAAVRNVRGIKSGSASRMDASPLCDAILDALDGWMPGKGYTQLRSATPGLAALTQDGNTYIPLAFTSRFRRTTACPQ